MTKIILISLLIISFVIISSKSETNECPNEVDDTQYSPRMFESEFIKIVECMRQKIKKGIPIWIFNKSLDPLQIRIPIPIRFKHISDDFISGRLILKKFRLEGLAGFELTKGNVSLTKNVSFRLNFKKIKLTSKYKAKMKLLGVTDIYGKGTLSVELNNFDIDSKVTVKVFPTCLTNLFLNLTLPATQVVMTGLFDDEYMSGLISTQLTDTLITLAQEEHERFNSILYRGVTHLIDTKVNPALEDLSISDLVALMNGLTKNCEEPAMKIVETVRKLMMDAGGIDLDENQQDYDDEF